MDNQELIASCRTRLQEEDEPDSSEWIDMVETLCNALEKTNVDLMAWRDDFLD